MKYWETIANRLMKAGWSLGWISAVDSEGTSHQSKNCSTTAGKPPMSRQWIADRLTMGSPSYVSNLLATVD
jgi:hypothetical protein